MSELRVGIIGCGRMGQERARCVLASGASVAAVYDPDLARAATLSKEFGAVVSLSGEHCLDQKLDAAFICIAPGYRGTLEMLCATQGIPFLVEKPIGLSAQDRMPLLRQLESRPVINAVGYMNRYRQSAGLARETLRHAKILGLSAHWVCRRYGVSWWADESLSGGPHNEQATHLFDLSRFLLGDIADIDSFEEGGATVSCLFRFASGIIGNSFYSCDAQAKDIGMRIFAQEGSLSLTGWDFRLTYNTINGVLSDAEEDIFLIETTAFLDAVRTGNQGLIASDFADAMKTQRVMDAAGVSHQRASVIGVRA